MASVTAIIYFLGLLGFINSFDHKNVTAYVGSNCVLTGYQSHQRVSWYWFDKKNTAYTLCKGNQRPTQRSGLYYSCTNNNITLLQVTKQYSGTYYGTNFNTEQDTYYSVKVLDPTTPRTTTKHTTTKKPTIPKTTKLTTTTSTTLAVTSQATTENELVALLQNGENNSSSPLPTTPSEQIPRSMIGIIAAVVVCMVIIILCMMYYACYYRKHRLNNKLDPY
ncbi:E3 24.8 kDa protein [Human mastadenovirus E]|uniref:E3 24.8 kDa protein n=2 Tax=Human mastadenovirus E TaxID=130308 RepID=Q8BEL4_ADE04|nr:E3 CR1-beta1 [Human mastadenovirus E]AAN64741.1 E3 24.8 kDa protein [Human adenovirus E4]AAS66935.1 E3 CR1-beta1 [Human mastadenovirus E]AAT97460.1 E3 24.8 kDa protein [Human adenovirus E4]AAT97508.1 E3 24.8 kDa protein [Human adenovirus E4]ANQ44126.1 membrane glycoprotein E3 CR1-beta [Human adenovirus E4]